LRVEIADIDNRGKISLVLVAEESDGEAADPSSDAPDTSTDSGAAPADAATASS
jgi:polyribonucleotide nucleotidyltransferase